LPGERAGRNHHPARRVAEDGHHLGRERPAESSPRLDRRADDDQLRAVLARHVRELIPERAVARADDPPVSLDAVRLRDGGRLRQRLAQRFDFGIEVGVERELLGNDERRDEHDVGAAIGREAAGEVERVLGLGATEERDDDAAVPAPHSS